METTAEKKQRLVEIFNSLTTDFALMMSWDKQTIRYKKLLDEQTQIQNEIGCFYRVFMGESEFVNYSKQKKGVL